MMGSKLFGAIAAAALLGGQNAFDNPFKGGVREEDIDFSKKERPLDKGEHWFYFISSGAVFEDTAPAGYEIVFKCRARSWKNAKRKFDNFIKSTT